MLTRTIVNAYHVIIEFILWLTLIAFVSRGYYDNGFWGIVTMFFIWLILSAVFIGGFLLIHDIRESVKNIEKMSIEKKKSS